LLLNFFLVTPITVGIEVGEDTPWVAVLVALPLFLLVLAWVTAILLKRRVIWPRGEPYRLNFWKVWMVVGEYFPFVHFVSAVVIPFMYWVACIELGVYNSNENEFTLSFGQVLAVFVAVPPLVQVSKLSPRLFFWFYNLTWLRRIDGDRAKSRHSSIDEGSMSLLDKPGHGNNYPLSGGGVKPMLSAYNPRLSQGHDRGRYSQLRA